MYILLTIVHSRDHWRKSCTFNEITDQPAWYAVHSEEGGGEDVPVEPANKTVLDQPFRNKTVQMCQDCSNPGDAYDPGVQKRKYVLHAESPC